VYLQVRRARPGSSTAPIADEDLERGKREKKTFGGISSGSRSIRRVLGAALRGGHHRSRVGLRFTRTYAARIGALSPGVVGALCMPDLA